MEQSSRFPLAELLGLEVELTEKGHSVASLVVGKKHLNPNSVVHGAVFFLMVDTGMGAATMSVLDQGKICASIEVHIRFLQAVGEGSIQAKTKVIRAGSRVVQLESNVYGPSERHIASATGTFAVIDARTT